jgi:hypothetical protein
MLLSWLGRLHGVFAAWVLLFLISSLVLAAGSGFRADRSRYPDPEFTSQSGRPRFITSLFRADDLQNRSVLLLTAPADAPGYVGMAPEVLERLVNGLHNKGMTVVRTDGQDPLPLAAGADVAVLTCNLPAYVDLDFQALADSMRGIYLFDYAGFWDSAAADNAGLMAQNFARVFWPHWQDPEMAMYVAHLEEKISPTDGVLLIPSGHLNTTAARARWYLALNEELSPRRFYLRNPDNGTSFVTEYFEWVQEYNEFAPWRGAQKVKLRERDFSALTHLAPTRTLSASEIAAAQSRDIQWVLFWSHQADFRLADWELVPLETVLDWNAEVNR